MLGAKARYMKKMLELVKQKVENKVIDITLKFTLSALWNLTGIVIHYALHGILSFDSSIVQSVQSNKRVQ